MEVDSPENMMRHIRFLKSEVERLKRGLRTTEMQRECLGRGVKGHRHGDPSQPTPTHHSSPTPSSQIIPTRKCVWILMGHHVNYTTQVYSWLVFLKGLPKMMLNL